MLYFLKSKKECTGCTACMSVCPKKCIKMEKDDEGFIYPHASESCIHCGMCMHVCPQIDHSAKPESDFKKRCFAAISRQYDTWQKSSSGGAFSDICRVWDDGNSIFVGAAWDKLYVKHTVIDDINEIGTICKSKYVASELTDSFLKIKEALLNDKKVVFCGTPCQVAGLKSFLKKNYDGLLLIDLICHGVGSQKVFQECIHVIESQFSMKIDAYEFRTKRSVYEKDYLAKISNSDGDKLYLSNDPYIYLFLKQNCLRPCCGENCKYRNENRQGDITLADFKGLTEVFPDLSGTKKNYSAIIINSRKGATVIDKLSTYMELRESSVDQIKKYNPLFYRQTWFSDNRDSFFNDFYVDPDSAIKKWSVEAVVQKKSLSRVIYDILPTRIRRQYQKIKSRIKQK